MPIDETYNMSYECPNCGIKWTNVKVDFNEVIQLIRDTADDSKRHRLPRDYIDTKCRLQHLKFMLIVLMDEQVMTIQGKEIPGVLRIEAKDPGSPQRVDRPTIRPALEGP